MVEAFNQSTVSEGLRDEPGRRQSSQLLRGHAVGIGHIDDGLPLPVEHGKRRFSDILNDVEGLSNRMLSKELKELEINQLVKRTVLDTQPIAVQYELTEHGNTLQTIISNLTDWGNVHRMKIVGK